MLVFHSSTQEPTPSLVTTSPTTLLPSLTYNSFQLPIAPHTYSLIALSLSHATIIQTRISNRMSQSGYLSEKTSLSLRQNSNRKSTRNRQVKSCIFRIPWQSESSPIELVKDLAEKVTHALRLISPRRSLHRDSSSLTRSKSAGSSVDSFRTAAVEDCIEFIHSSFSRSNSSTTASREDSMQAP